MHNKLVLTNWVMISMVNQHMLLKMLCYDPIYLDKASMHLFLHEKISFMMHDFLTAFYWRDVAH